MPSIDPWTSNFMKISFRQGVSADIALQYDLDSSIGLVYVAHAKREAWVGKLSFNYPDPENLLGLLAKHAKADVGSKLALVARDPSHNEMCTLASQAFKAAGHAQYLCHAPHPAHRLLCGWIDRNGQHARS